MKRVTLDKGWIIGSIFGYFDIKRFEIGRSKYKFKTLLNLLR